MRVLFMVFLFLAFEFFNSPGILHADDEKAFDLKLSSVPADEFSGDLAQMHDFMKTQQEKQQKIELLSLDLEQAKIEVELRQKRVALGKYMDESGYSQIAAQKAVNSSDNKFKSVTVTDTDPDVKSVFVTPSYKEAILEVDGSEITVKEGDKIGAVTVKKIDSNGVTLVKENNEEIKINIKE